jgi:hypothetical protein
MDNGPRTKLILRGLLHAFTGIMAAAVAILAAAIAASMSGYGSAIGTDDLERFVALRSLQLAHADLTLSMSVVVFFGTVVAILIQILRSFVVVAATTEPQRARNLRLVVVAVMLVVGFLIPGYDAARTMVCASAVQVAGMDRLAVARRDTKGGDEAAIRAAAKLETPVRIALFRDCARQQDRWNLYLSLPLRN